MKVPPDWHPGHPGYAQHLARGHLRGAAAMAEAVLDMIGVDDPRAVVMRAMAGLLRERQGE